MAGFLSRVNSVIARLQNHRHAKTTELFTLSKSCKPSDIECVGGRVQLTNLQEKLVPPTFPDSTAASYSNLPLVRSEARPSQPMLPAEQDGQHAPEPVLPGHIPFQGYHRSIHSFDEEVGTHSSHTIVNDSTGKEVVDVGYDGLQVDEARFPRSHKTGRKSVGMEVVNFAPNEKEVFTCPEPTRKRGSRKKLLLAAVVGLVILITAAVVGGVLGSRNAHGGSSSGADQSQSSPTSTSSVTKPTETSTVTLTSLRLRSKLSVAAWRKSQGLQIFLYYQSQNGSLRWSNYDDTQSSFTYNGSYWGDSTEVVMDSLDSAANDTSLAAGMLLWDTTYEVRYLYGNDQDISYLYKILLLTSTFHSHKSSSFILIRTTICAVPIT